MLQGIPTVREAVDKHIADAEARNLKPESLKKVRDVVRRRLLDYCSHEGYRTLRQLDVDAVREFRNRLVRDYSPNSARKRYEYVRSFFRFCHQSGWITANPAALVKPPRPDQSQTLPFDTQQFADLLKAAESDHADYFFWNGRCLPMSAVKIWERTFARLFELAKIPGVVEPSIACAIHLRWNFS